MTATMIDGDVKAYMWRKRFSYPSAALSQAGLSVGGAGRRVYSQFLEPLFAVAPSTDARRREVHNASAKTKEEEAVFVCLMYYTNTHTQTWSRTPPWGSNHVRTKTVQPHR